MDLSTAAMPCSSLKQGITTETDNPLYIRLLTRSHQEPADCTSELLEPSRRGAGVTYIIRTNCASPGHGDYSTRFLVVERRVWQFDKGVGNCRVFHAWDPCIS